MFIERRAIGVIICFEIFLSYLILSNQFYASLLCFDEISKSNTKKSQFSSHEETMLLILVVL